MLTRTNPNLNPNLSNVHGGRPERLFTLTQTKTLTLTQTLTLALTLTLTLTYADPNHH